jgi:hypothetical protein
MTKVNEEYKINIMKIEAAIQLEKNDMNKMCLMNVKHYMESQQEKLEELQEYLELAVSQQDQCPICKRWDFRELGHVSNCFMRTLPNGNTQYSK